MPESGAESPDVSGWVTVGQGGLDVIFPGDPMKVVLVIPHQPWVSQLHLYQEMRVSIRRHSLLHISVFNAQGEYCKTYLTAIYETV